MKRKAFVSTVVVLLVLADQLTKEIARRVLGETGPVAWAGGLVSWELAENPGAFLSLGAQFGEGLRFLLFSVGVVVVLGWAVFLLVKRPELPRLEVWGLSLLLGGGTGNLIDRLAKGSVTDFLQIGFPPLQTGVFNLADMAIMVGVGFLFFTSFKNPKSLSS